MAEARELPALPPRGEGDGYDWMGEAEAAGWVAIGGWGRDGWDLGDWPYVIILTCVARVPCEEVTRNVYGVASYCEGDVERWAFDTHEERIWKLDELAHFYWRLRWDSPPYAPPIGPLPEELFGPYSARRVEEALLARRAARAAV